MKYPLLLITTTVIIFFIYLGMATITMMPPTNNIQEVQDAIDVFDIKDIKIKPQAKFTTRSKLASLNVKPKKSDTSNMLRTHLFSDINNEQDKLVKSIDMKKLFPQSPTNFKNELAPSIDNTNLGAQVLKPLYPYEAYRNNINGWVILKLFISKFGKVVDVEVLDSNPKGIFENTAIKAAYKKKFPINEELPEPKAYTKNINIMYNATD
jgi:TonB family protein